MTDESLPIRRFSWRVPITNAKGEPTRDHYQFIGQLQHWVPQTAVLDAGVQAQLSEVRYSVEGVQSGVEQVRAEVGTLKGDPRLEAGQRAEQLALAALQRSIEAGDKDAARDALKLAETAIIQTMARQDAKFTQEIGEVYAVVSGLQQQVSLQRTIIDRLSAAADQEATLNRGIALQHVATSSANGARETAEIARVGVEELDATFDARADGRIAAAVGSSVQAYSANLDEFSAVNPTAAGLALLDDANAADQRTTLGLEIGTDVLAYVAPSPGWSAATGTATRTTFDTATVTLPQLAERVKALIDDGLTANRLGA